MGDSPAWSTAPPPTRAGFAASLKATTPSVVHAERLLRRMRGGTQAHLLAASDGHSYVVKTVENPQHRRVLVNDWIGAALLKMLGIGAPEAALLRLSPRFLRETPDLCVRLTHGSRPVSAGVHFASRFAGRPGDVVYDFLPDAILSAIDRSPFLGALVFDKWVSNTDSRQVIFVRRHSAGQADRRSWAIELIDNGHILGGTEWKLGDSAPQGLYHRRAVYQGVRGLRDFDPWIERVRSIAEETVWQAVKQIPETWLETGTAHGPGDDRLALEQTLLRLFRRRERVADLIVACRRGMPEAFPHWAGPL